MKTAVIYARYSSDTQTEQSIEGQLHVCEDYATRNDMVILNTYIDRAMTGTNDNRPDFQRMIADSNKNRWDVVLVYKFDRFSRNKYETAKYKHILRENGVKVVSAMENIPDSPEGIILESVIEGMNQYYSEELSQKVRRGMKETRAKGNFPGGYLLYGYKLENHKVLIDEPKAEIVRYIFEQYSIGVYVKDIIETLTAQGVYNREKPFARTTVYKILQNEKYAGIYRHEDEIFEGIYPQIVPTDIYKKVRTKIAENKNGKASVTTRYLLKNKVVCGICGKPMTGISGTSKTGAVSHYYRCKGKCGQPMIRREILDDTVLQSVISELSDKETLNKIVSHLVTLQNERIGNNPQLQLLQKEKRQAESALENILKGIEMGIMNHTTNKRMKELEETVEDLERKLLIEQSKSAVRLSEEQIRSYYTEALQFAAPSVMEVLVRKAIVTGETVEVYYNSPINTDSPDDKSGLLLCEKAGKCATVIHREMYKTSMKTKMFI